MKRATLTTVWVIFACGLLICPQSASALGAEPKNMAVPADLVVKLEQLFKQFYPEIAVTNRGLNGLTFEYRVGTFEFPDPGKGKRQDSVQRGPKPGGVLCRVYCHPGTYQGQTVLFERDGEPQQGLYDRQWYKVLLMAPYSEERNAHLWVALSYPDDVKEEFLTKFRQIMREFEGRIGGEKRK